MMMMMVMMIMMMMMMMMIKSNRPLSFYWKNIGELLIIFVIYDAKHQK